jgi:hypothetical protein
MSVLVERIFLLVWQTGLDQLFTQQYDIALYPVSEARISQPRATANAVLEAVQAAYLNMPVLCPAQPGTPPGDGRIEQLQGVVVTFASTHR